MHKINSESKKKRRHGPAPRTPDELRKIRVSVFLTEQEANDVRHRAASTGINPSAYLRAAVLGRTPKQIPAINREAWNSLARVAGNLNQYQTSINEGRAHGYPPEVLIELRNLVQSFRCDLIGVKLTDEEEDEGDGQD